MRLSEKELNEIENYRIFSYVNYYVYNYDIKEILNLCDAYPYNKCILFNDRFLSILDSFIVANKELEIIDEDSRNNVFEIVNYIRQNKRYENKEEKEIYINKYNNIIRNLNSTISGCNYEMYVHSELCSREYSGGKLIRNDILFDEDIFRESLAYDINIIEALLKPDEEFNEFTQSMIADEYYFSSIIKFSRDIPEIFKDDDMCSRIESIFKLNKCNKDLYFTSPSTMYKNARTLRLVKKMSKK